MPSAFSWHTALVNFGVGAYTMSIDKKLERSNKERVFRRLAKVLEPTGFHLGKSRFFTRASLPVIEFVHLHKFSFAPSFRVHVGIRVVNDPFVAVALNGPNSDEIVSPTGARYDFQYCEDDESVDRCVSKIAEFVSNVAEPWFGLFRNRTLLIIA